MVVWFRKSDFYTDWLCFSHFFLPYCDFNGLSRLGRFWTGSVDILTNRRQHFLTNRKTAFLLTRNNLIIFNQSSRCLVLSDKWTYFSFGAFRKNKLNKKQPPFLHVESAGNVTSSYHATPTIVQHQNNNDETVTIWQLYLLETTATPQQHLKDALTTNIRFWNSTCSKNQRATFDVFFFQKNQNSKTQFLKIFNRAFDASSSFNFWSDRRLTEKGKVPH